MIKRTLAAIFGAVLFGVIVPIVYFVALRSFPLEGVKGIALLAGSGALLGAVLGALFPKVFGFVFEIFMDL